jgi:hypothetical protein
MSCLSCLLTRPSCPPLRSFTKDLSRQIFELVIRHRSTRHFTGGGVVYHVMILNMPEDMLTLTHLTSQRATYRHFPAWILAAVHPGPKPARVT